MDTFYCTTTKNGYVPMISIGKRLALMRLEYGNAVFGNGGLYIHSLNQPN